MEIIDHTPKTSQRESRVSVTRPRNLFIGILLICAGLIWLLNNFNIIQDAIFNVFFSWQVLVILIGAYLLVLRKWIPGGIISLFGFSLLLIKYMHWQIPMDKVILPILFVAAGLCFLFMHNDEK